MPQSNIHYLVNSDNGIELILCSDSKISYPLHNHISVVAMGVVLEGAVTLTMEHSEKIYRKNEAFVIFPYVPHSLRADNKYTLFSCCVGKNIIENTPRKIIENNIMSLSEYLPPLCNFDLPEIFSRLNFADIYRQELTYTDAFINRRISSLEAFPEIPLSLDEMAQKALISKFRFIEKFKKQAGLTPHRFQLQNRLRKAKQLLNNTGTLTQAALTAGFFDQSHFIREFKKHVGLTPLDYKNSLQIICTKKQLNKEAE